MSNVVPANPSDCVRYARHIVIAGIAQRLPFAKAYLAKKPMLNRFSKRWRQPEIQAHCHRVLCWREWFG